MAKATDTEGLIRQNLTDAGCSENETEQFMALMREGKADMLKKLLAGKRKVLLEDLNRSQRQIDCLDYFTYRLGKESIL